MSNSERSVTKVAILDLYEGFPNQGMRCIREILHTYADVHHLNMQVDEFDVRLKNEVPDTSYDIYISSGGPGSPLDSTETIWEQHYFKWLKSIERYNENPANFAKKYVFFICHSYQLVCRHYNVGTVCKRKSTSFGVFPIHMLNDGFEEPIFTDLKDPFFVVDSRDYQVIEPNHNQLNQMGGKILAVEKERPHVPYERAIMSIRFNDYFFGTQFHPEADAVGMSLHLQTPDRKKTVIENHGEAKWSSMVEQLNDPDKILYTYNHILPNFLNTAIGHPVLQLA